MSSIRQQRVARLLVRQLSDLIRQELQDPRIGFITVTRAEMSADLQHARVYISLMGDDEARANSLAGLQSAAGFLRRRVGRGLKLRHTPEIRFFADESLDAAERIQQLLARTDTEEKPIAPSDDDRDRATHP